MTNAPASCRGGRHVPGRMPGGTVSGAGPLAGGAGVVTGLARDLRGRGLWGRTVCRPTIVRRTSGLRTLGRAASRLRAVRIGTGRELLGAVTVAVGHPPQPVVHVAHEEPQRDGRDQERDEAPDAG